MEHIEDTEETEAMIKSLERYLEELKLLVRIGPNFMNATKYKVILKYTFILSNSSNQTTLF